MRLQTLVFGCLAVIGGVGIWLLRINGTVLSTPVVRITLACFIGALSLAGVLWLMSIVPSGSSPGRRHAWYRLGAGILALCSLRYLFPLVMTLASYGLVPHSLALADEWLSWPERMLGITHPVVYRACEAWGLLPAMELAYDSLWLQTIVMLVWFGLVRRRLGPLWETAAGVSVAASIGLMVLWLAPAIGPWAYYGHAAYGHPAPPVEAAFLSDFMALRGGHFTTLNAPQGLMTIPSFHVVFAVLFAWAFRRERWLYPIAIAWNAGVIVATFPMGWHYLTDLAAGGLLAAGALGLVRRLQGAPEKHPAAAAVVPADRFEEGRAHRGKWSLQPPGSQRSI